MLLSIFCLGIIFFTFVCCQTVFRALIPIEKWICSGKHEKLLSKTYKNLMVLHDDQIFGGKDEWERVSVAFSLLSIRG